MRDARVDAYIEAAADFAKPILVHLRDLVHEVRPDVEEGIKWSRPHFGHHGMLCGLVAFKEHCTFGFWKPELAAEVPDDLADALARNAKARATFEAFSPSHRREYVEWITEARRAETRARRIDQTLARLAEGKPRNWKYM